MSFKSRSGYALKDMFESLGNEGTSQAILEMLKKGEVGVEDFDLKEIFESVSSDMFPALTGELVNAVVIAGYKNEALIGDQLCTTIPSKMEVEKIAGLDSLQGPEPVLQGMEYNSSSMGERYVTSENLKYGRLLALTEETIHFDKSGEFLRRAAKFGEKAAIHRERLILNGVQDVVGYRSYRPSGIVTDVYSANNSNLNTSNAFGESGLSTVWTTFQGQTDSEGDPILLGPSTAICLVPVGLWNNVNQMARSAHVPEGNENAINTYKGTFTPLTSPFVTIQNATTWFFGNFRKAFAWLEVWPIQTLRQKEDSDFQFRRDIKAVFKIRLYGSLACLDPKYVQKSTT